MIEKQPRIALLIDADNSPSSKIDVILAELAKLGVVTTDAARVSANATVVTENAAQLSTLFAATLGGPLVKTAAFTYGIRKAVKGRKAS